LNNTIKKILQWAITLVLLVASVWYAFKGIEFDKMADIFAEINYIYAILPVPIILLSHWMRAWRWKTFLTPIKEIKSVYSLFSAVMILYAVNAITPRAGEFLRPLIISRKEKISYSSTFATIILERVIDVISLMLLFGVTFILLREKVLQLLPQDMNPNMIIIIIVLLIGIALINLYPPFVNSMLRIFIKPISVKLYEKLLSIVDKFKRGLAIVKSPKQYFRISLETAIIWFLYSFPLYIIFFAFDFQNTHNLGFIDATMLVIVAGIGVTIAPTPGAVGVFHVLVSGAMVSLYGIDKEVALAYATVVHAVSKLTETIVGAGFFFKEGISLKSEKEVIEVAK
jgi:glycosyltransferase 2 family protein